MELKESLKNLVFDKNDLKGQVYYATKDAFELFRKTTHELIDLLKEQAQK